MIFFGSGVLLPIGLLVMMGALVFLGPLAPFVLVIALPVILLVALAGPLARRHSASRQLPDSDWGMDYELDPREFAEVRRAAQDDLLALADDIRALDLDIELPGATPAAKEDYARALDQYDHAKRALDRAQLPEDLEAVSSAVEEGRFAMATAKARLEGREPPARRPPCFFDPRHGPSVRDVEWAPAGGTSRPVPACAADAIRIEEGREPLAREVFVAGERRPYWEAPAYYGPWAGGYFGGFGPGLLPALFFGSMLGGGLALGAPVVFGEDFESEDFDGDYGSDLGAGDFGGE